MESKVILSTAKEQLKSVGLNNKLRVIKSDFFLVKMFDFIKTKKTLETIKYNKYIQKRINININNYKAFSELYSSIEVEITLDKNIRSGHFIIIENDDKRYCHIYLNNNKKTKLKILI